MDGVYGALIIREPKLYDPHADLYDLDLPEHVILVTDWLTEMSLNRFTGHHHSDYDNKPKSALINGRGKYQAHTIEETEREHFTPRTVFEVGENAHRYRFRVISNGMLFCPLRLSIDHHKLLVIASDGQPFEPFLADSLVLFAGERFDFLLAEPVNPPANHWLRITGLGDCSDEWYGAHQEAILRYTGAPLEEPRESDDYQTDPPGGEDGMELNPLNQNLTPNCKSTF